MQANWSLILNVLLLGGVVVALVRLLRAKRKADLPVRVQPSMGTKLDNMDEVIAVRKITRESPLVQAAFSPSAHQQKPTPRVPGARIQPAVSTVLDTEIIDTPVLVKSTLEKPSLEKSSLEKTMLEKRLPSQSNGEHSSVFLLMFLLAKDNRQLAGYELLQTILSAGLRFGEGQLFHRHQYPNGQGPILCSLATATATGVFDLQNIGAFSVHGLCLYMQAAGSTTIDLERLALMIDTAKQLSEGLNTHILDDERKPWSDASEKRYVRMLQHEIEEAVV